MKRESMKILDDARDEYGDAPPPDEAQVPVDASLALDAALVLGESAADLRHDAEAERQFRAAIALGALADGEGGDARVSTARRRLARVLARRGAVGEAVVEMERALAGAESTDGLEELAGLLRRANRPEDAWAAEQRAEALYRASNREHWSRADRTADAWGFYRRPPKDLAASEAQGYALRGAEHVLEWSYGRVTVPQHMDEGTGLPVRGGIGCPVIFGPVRDLCCACGKYAGAAHAGAICEVCRGECGLSSLRGVRCGHVELAAPVLHPWLYRGGRGPLAAMLGLRPDDLKALVAGQKWAAISARDDVGVRVGEVVTEAFARRLTEEYGEDSFQARTGTRAVALLLDRLYLLGEVAELGRALGWAGDARRRARLMRRRAVLAAFRDNLWRPERAVLTALPVPPPAAPLPPRAGGKARSRARLEQLLVRVISANGLVRAVVDHDGGARDDRAPGAFEAELQSAVDALFGFLA